MDNHPRTRPCPALIIPPWEEEEYDDNRVALTACCSSNIPLTPDDVYAARQAAEIERMRASIARLELECYNLENTLALERMSIRGVRNALALEQESRQSERRANVIEVSRLKAEGVAKQAHIDRLQKECNQLREAEALARSQDRRKNGALAVLSDMIESGAGDLVMRGSAFERKLVSHVARLNLGHPSFHGGLRCDDADGDSIDLASLFGEQRPGITDASVRAFSAYACRIGHVDRLEALQDPDEISAVVDMLDLFLASDEVKNAVVDDLVGLLDSKKGCHVAISESLCRTCQIVRMPPPGSGWERIRKIAKLVMERHVRQLAEASTTDLDDLVSVALILNKNNKS
jgi:hypothetical protein